LQEIIFNYLQVPNKGISVKLIPFFVIQAFY